jgi:hypothetical protein
MLRVRLCEMSNCSQLNCSSLWNSPPLLQPNPDVSGIGVSPLRFSINVITHLLILLGARWVQGHYLHNLDPSHFHYVVVYDPEMAGSTHEANEHPNPIDRKVLRWTSAIANRPS